MASESIETKMEKLNFFKNAADGVIIFWLINYGAQSDFRSGAA